MTPTVSWWLCMARASCLRLFEHLVRAAASRTFWTAGRSRPMRMAMIAITTNNSISVKPGRGRRFGTGEDCSITNLRPWDDGLGWRAPETGYGVASLRGPGGPTQGAVTDAQVVPRRSSSMVCRVLLLTWTSNQSKTRLLWNDGPATVQLPG